MGMRIMHDYLGGFWHWFTTPWALSGGVVIEPIGMVEFLIILVFYGGVRPGCGGSRAGY